MSGGTVAVFIIALTVFITAVVMILYKASTTIVSSLDETVSGLPLPNSSLIGAQCSVGCTCFPNPAATQSTDKPTQKCAYLSNDVMFDCPSACCQPTCI